MALSLILETAEALLQLDPVRSYPERGADWVARIANVPVWRLELLDGRTMVQSELPPDAGASSVALPLRHGRDSYGTLHLYPRGGPPELDGEPLRLARWATRIFARGLSYAARLAGAGSRRTGEEMSDTLARAPLTPRERDVVALLVSGASTRDIASRSGLTVSTVNTYLKRIFSKLGVHSRVELVARLAGTDAPHATNGHSQPQALPEAEAPLS